MAKFRKKPVVIEATQWLGHPELPDLVQPFYGIVNWADDCCPHCRHTREEHGWVVTYEGGHVACPTDWIIIGVKGEKYPCKDEIFKLTYEKVE